MTRLRSCQGRPSWHYTFESIASHSFLKSPSPWIRYKISVRCMNLKRMTFKTIQVLCNRNHMESINEVQGIENILKLVSFYS